MRLGAVAVGLCALTWTLTTAVVRLRVPPASLLAPLPASAEARSLQAVEERFGRASPEHLAALDTVIAALLQRPAGASDETLALARQAVQFRRRLFGGPGAAGAIALENLGRVHSVRGEHLLAIPHLRRACALRASSEDAAAPGDCLQVLAAALIHTSQFAEADSVLTQAQALYEGGVGPDRLPLSRVLALSALRQRWMGQYGNANATLDRALNLRKGLDADSDDRLMLVLLNGDLRWLTGDILGARHEYQTAAAMPHPSLREALDHVVALRRLAWADDVLGELTQAIDVAEQAERAGAELLAACHDERAALLNDRAAIARDRGDYVASKELFQQALREKTRCAAVNGADIVTPLWNLADLAESMGDAFEAEAFYTRAEEAWSSRYGADHPFVGLAVDGLARASLL